MERKLQILLLASLLGLMLAACETGQKTEKASAPPGANITVTAEAVSVTDNRTTILWQFQLAAGWHLYANLRNDSGFPPSVALTLPDGWTAGPLQWPVPERHLAAGDILDHVYYDRLVLLQELTLPPTVAAGQTFTIPARVDWLICRDSCVPGRAEIDLKVSAGAASQELLDSLAQARATLPTPAPAEGLTLTWRENTVEIFVPGAEALEFYPAEDCALLVDVIADAVGESNRLRLRLRARDGRIGSLSGILHQQLADGRIRNWTIAEPSE